MKMPCAIKSGRKIVYLLPVGVLLAAIGGAMFPLLDYIIREEIKKRVVISNTSELYDIWQDIPVPVYMQFYMFNVTNMEEIKQGEKPAVAEIGPYTYRERRVKFNIVWNPNGTVTYRQNRTFTFIPEMSVGEDTDNLTTLNPLICVISQGLQWLPGPLKEAVSFVLEIVSSEELFVKRPVKELLWGYDDPSLVLLNKVLPTWFSTTKIGYFIRKNYTDDGLYTVVTGATNIDELGGISRYNGKRHLDIWTTEWANMVNGTDGTLGPPFRFDSEWSPLFVSDICRSIRGIYRGETHTPQGIKLRSFGGNPYDMANATINPDNIGFCTPQSRCLPTGLLNSTLCQEPVDDFPIPLIFSFPHFLNADPDVVNSVYGMRPDPKQHDTVVDVEPWTGMVLQAAKRLQINMFVEKVPGIRQTHNIRRLFFPIVWLNESSVVDDKHANMLTDELFTPMTIGNVAKIALLCIGALMTVMGFALLIRRSYLLSQAEHKDVTFNGGGLQNPTRNSNPPVMYSDPIPDSAAVTGDAHQTESEDGNGSHDNTVKTRSTANGSQTNTVRPILPGAYVQDDDRTPLVVSDSDSE